MSKICGGLARPSKVTEKEAVKSSEERVMCKRKGMEGNGKEWKVQAGSFRQEGVILSIERVREFTQSGTDCRHAAGVLGPVLSLPVDSAMEGSGFIHPQSTVCPMSMCLR